ncbi:monovalent cation/H+ antiporter subunit D [Paracoccus nototheniae]|uniref:Monovalent cation/H+ antiporter subunit D n=1 Tax=Paracoccus nototheniae TaxID=2489002 RepID=A0ABW4DWB1_9RHOB|nr:monovalent cation/H+ antiporter subunit D [Paracoccus nototheniae]
MNPHLIIAPILIPFVAGALMLLYDDRQRVAKFWLSLISVGLVLAGAVRLMVHAGADQGPAVYLLGDWAAPVAIVLVLDRLAALMLVLTAVLALASLVYARASWHRQGQHYFSLFQFLLMGLNGAFLTGDLFNLFVFFEVLLAASYGLLLHGSGRARVQAGLHYIAINLGGSLLFLLGVSLIYGLTGTLNMAQLATMMPQIPGADRPLVHLGFGLLGIAFLIKSGSWPLSFWLPNAYEAAPAPVGAMFAIMTKLGVYAILRLGMLMLGAGAGASAGYGAVVLVALGLATVIFGMMGVLASRALGRIAAHSVIVSSGTVLAVVGFALAGGGTGLLAGALYYMVGSTLAVAALFLLVEPATRDDGGIAAMLALTAEIYGSDPGGAEGPDTPDGPALPAGRALLSLCFAACLLALAGLPPLPGFIGKLVMVQGALGGPAGLSPAMVWGFVALLLLSGFATLVALARIGIQTFWASDDGNSPVMALEIAPPLALIALLAVLSIGSEPALRYAGLTAAALQDPAGYATGVLNTPRTAKSPAGVPETASPLTGVMP